MKRLRGPAESFHRTLFPEADFGGPRTRRQGGQYRLHCRTGRALGGAQTWAGFATGLFAKVGARKVLG